LEYHENEEKMTTLRDMTESDLVYVTKWRNDPQVNRYLTNRVKTKDEAEAWYKHVKGNPKNWLKIILYDNQPVGYAIIEDVDTTRRKCEIAIIIGARNLWGSGIGTTVIEEIKQYCFDKLHLHRILGIVARGNNRSIRLLEKAGFTHEGTLRDSLLIDNQFTDLLCYSMLEGEYKK
jgi:RimJ/RimL family protein N-acetyltransferase